MGEQDLTVGRAEPIQYTAGSGPPEPLTYCVRPVNTVSVYPVPRGDQDFEQAIAPYRSSKGTLRFALSEPIPYELIHRLATLLAAERAAQ